MNLEPVTGWATDCRDKYAENHDSGYAGRICMSDGNLAWAAVIADGCGGSMEGLKVSALAIQAFTDAVRKSSLAELSDPSSRDAWLRAWTKQLHSDSISRFKGGMSTFCGAVILPPWAASGAHCAPSDPSDPPSYAAQSAASDASEASRRAASAAQTAAERPDGAQCATDWKLFTLNVGDSQVLKLTGDGKCMGITPDAPPNNANVEGHNPIRVVGVAPKADFALIDVEEFPLPDEGPCWILAGSDGFFSKKRGKDEVCIFSSGDLRDVCRTSRAPFHELPALAIRRSLANAQKLGCAEMMDNATVAMLGFRIPPTDLAVPAAPAGTAAGARNAPSDPSGRLTASPSSAARNAASDVSEANRRAAPAAQTPARPAGGATRPSSAKRPLAQMAAVAAAALVIGLIFGKLVFGRSCTPARENPAATAKPDAPAIAAPVDLRGVPGKGRCKYCLGLVEKGELKMEDAFHWAEKCDRNPSLVGAQPESSAKP